jgi:hypothetical protein
VHTLGKFNTPITSKPPKRPMDMLFCCGRDKNLLVYLFTCLLVYLFTCLLVYL